MALQKQYIPILEGKNILFTEEGGTCFKLINKTGAPSVKGQAISLSADYDDSYVAATDPYVVNGFVYEAGVADGEGVWVVRDGVADALLHDGYGTLRNAWVRLSATDAGRIVTQLAPGYERAPTSVAYTTGSTFSGSLANLLVDDGTKMVFAEASGTPGLDAVFTFNVSELLPALTVAGYYPGNHSNGIQFYVWNFSGSSWGTALVTLPASGANDIVYTANGLTSDNFSAGEMRVRMYHPDPGNTGHRVYLDKFVLAATSANEHFRECGHTMRAVSPGTDVLVRINIHFL